MAAIDKTYVTSLEEYKSVVEWCRNNSFTCPNGQVLNPINYCYGGYTDDEITNWLKNAHGSIPVMNTSLEMDYFLIKYCPLKLVQDRLKDVYDEEYYNSVKNGTSAFDTFVRPEGGKHYRFLQKPYFTGLKHKHYNKYAHKKCKGIYGVCVRLSDDRAMWYSDECDIFKHPDELGYDNCSHASPKCKTVRALMRKIIKWNLPVGSVVEVDGPYVGNGFKVVITK